MDDVRPYPKVTFELLRYTLGETAVKLPTIRSPDPDDWINDLEPQTRRWYFRVAPLGTGVLFKTSHLSYTDRFKVQCKAA